MIAHPQPPFELELASRDSLWVDRLRRGIWPKPLVYWAVVFYIGLFIIRPWEKLFPDLGPLRFERTSVIAIALIVAATRGVFVKLSAQNITMILLFAAVYLSGKLAFDTELAAPEVTEFFGFALIFFLIQKAVRTPYQLLFIVASYLMLTAAYTGKSIWEYALNGGAKFEMGVYRLQGIDWTYGHPNTFGTSMLCSLPFTIYFYRVRDRFTQTWPGLFQKAFRYVLLLHGSLCILGILLTRSRSTAIGVVLFAGLLVSRQHGMMKKAKWAVVAGMAFIVGFTFAPSDIQNRIRTLWDSSVEHQEGMGGANASASGRLEGLYAGVAIFQRFPVTGVGIGNFAEYRAEFVDQEKLDAHNLPGELLGSIGLLGTSAFVCFLFVHCLAVRKLSRVGKDYANLTGNDVYSLLALALYDALLLMLFSSLSGHTLQQYQWYFFASFTVVGVHFARQELAQAKVSLASAEREYA